MRTISVLFLSFLLSLHQLQASSQKASSVSVEQYCAFLNTSTSNSLSSFLATLDPHEIDEPELSYHPNDLYDSKMNHEVVRIGEPGGYLYATCSNENLQSFDINFVNRNEALLYCHWEKTHAPFSVFGAEVTSIDRLLCSNQVKIKLVFEECQSEEMIKKTDVDWSASKIILSALITIGTIFSEGHFSLEEARINSRERLEAAVSNDLRIESRCQSSKAVLESLKGHDPASRLLAEHELLHPKKSSSSSLDSKDLSKDPFKEAADLESRLQRASQVTLLGELDHTRSHIFSGLGHLVNCGFSGLSPILDNGRRITAGGIMGYGLGASITFLGHGNALLLMSNGALGATLGVLPFFLSSFYRTYTQRAQYFQVLSEHWNKTKVSFSLAPQSFCDAWDFRKREQKIVEARHECRTFYQKLLDQCDSETEENSTPKKEKSDWGQSRLFLEAQSHAVINAISDNKRTAFEKFIQMGEKFYDREMIQQVMPDEERGKIVDNFHEKKDSILAELRSLHISMHRQWQKENDRKGQLLDMNDSDFLKSSPSEKLEYIKNHYEDLKNFSSNEVEKIKAIREKGFYKDFLLASSSLAGEATLLGLKTATKSILGFLVGSFIDNAFPISFSNGDLYHPLITADTVGVLYGAYFLCIDLSNGNNMIRTSAQKTTQAYAHLLEVLGRSQKQLEAQEQLRFREEKLEIAQKKLEQFQQDQQMKEDLFSPEDYRFIPRDNWRTSTMPKVREKKETKEEFDETRSESDDTCVRKLDFEEGS
jgi:hypothetical protein